MSAKLHRPHRSRPAAWLLLLLPVLLGAGILAAAAAAAGELSLPDNPLQGRLLFESRGCVRCHGIAYSRTGPDLSAGHFGDSFLEFGAALWDHVPGMSVEHEVSGLPWPQLDEREAVELIAFLYDIDYLGRPGVASHGQRLFGEKGCASCHSIGGRGGGDVGPDLGKLTRFASPLDVAQAIWNHGPSMFEAMRDRHMKPPSFEEGDLADLSAYLRQAGQHGPQERTLLAPGNPNHGRKVFGRKGCSKCHGERGQGGNDGPDLRDAELHRSADGIAGLMWNHALEMGRTMRARGIGWPDFTTSELADVVAFLYFLSFDDPPGQAARGEQVFASRSCAGCHAGDAAGEHRGPDLAGAGAARSPAALVAAMWNHAPIMEDAILGAGQPWPSLTGANLRDLLAYLEQAAESAASPTDEGD